MPVTRRAALAGAALATVAAAPAPGTAWDFEFPSIDEGTLRLADFRGKVLTLPVRLRFDDPAELDRRLDALFD